MSNTQNSRRNKCSCTQKCVCFFGYETSTRDVNPSILLLYSIVCRRFDPCHCCFLPRFLILGDKERGHPRYVEAPIIPGHEFVGEVVKLGPGTQLHSIIHSYAISFTEPVRCCRCWRKVWSACWRSCYI